MGNGWDRRGRREEFASSDKDFILARDARRCYLCGRAADEVDHVVPIAEGGPNDPSNGRAICARCHREKSYQEMLRGMERRRRKLRLPPEPHPFYAGRPDAKHAETDR